MASWRRAVGSMLGSVEGFGAKETGTIDFESRAAQSREPQLRRALILPRARTPLPRPQFPTKPYQRVQKEEEGRGS